MIKINGNESNETTQSNPIQTNSIPIECSIQSYLDLVFDEFYHWNVRNQSQVNVKSGFFFAEIFN